MVENTPDKLLEGMGLKMVMGLTLEEIDELKEISIQKAAYLFNMTNMREWSKEIFRHETVFFEKVYERLNLNKSLPYIADWRKGEITIMDVDKC